MPPIAEQRRIAEILDKADALRAKRRAAIAQLDTLTQSIFLDMFGDPATNPKEWKVRALTDVCYCYSGGTPSKNLESNWAGVLPWFTPKDLKKDNLFDSEDHINESLPDNSSLKLLPAGTVAIVVRGMILAHTFPVAVLRVPSTINQDLKALLPRSPLNEQFLAHCLRVQSSRVLEWVSESAHGTKRLDGDALSRIRILIVPDSMQVEFSRRVEAVEHLQVRLASSLKQQEEVFASLQSHAFNGWI